MHEILATIEDPERMRALVETFGPWGPLAIILGLAGAAYGGFWGTVYVVVGAELGALIAFTLARRFGYDAVRKLPWVARWIDRTQSQAALAGLVFLSRLLPFLSFDVVSYAAGLTPLRLPWFALATFAGVLPISILLVWFGEHMAAAGAAWIGIAVLVAGGVTLLPLLWKRVRGG